MKTLKKQIKPIALIFGVLILFQSCKAYYKDSVTLEQAVNQQNALRLKPLQNKLINFKA